MALPSAIAFRVNKVKQNCLSGLTTYQNFNPEKCRQERGKKGALRETLNFIIRLFSRLFHMQSVLP